MIKNTLLGYGSLLLELFPALVRSRIGSPSPISLRLAGPRNLPGHVSEIDARDRSRFCMSDHDDPGWARYVKMGGAAEAARSCHKGYTLYYCYRLPRPAAILRVVFGDNNT